MAPLISVLLTSYNREGYIAEAIESVLAQSHGDFELVVSDDCSTDRSTITHAYAQHDDRIRVTINEQNLGHFGNRRVAASWREAGF